MADLPPVYEDDYRETVETRGMSDRDLMLATFHKARAIEKRLTELNGTVADHETEIYGDKGRLVIGLKEQSVANTAAIKTAKVVFATLSAIVSIIGVANLVAIVALIGRT